MTKMTHPAPLCSSDGCMLLAHDPDAPHRGLTFDGDGWAVSTVQSPGEAWQVDVEVPGETLSPGGARALAEALALALRDPRLSE